MVLKFMHFKFANFYTWLETINLYDGVMLFAKVIQEMIENDLNILSGEQIYENMINRKYQSKVQNSEIL